MPLRRRGERMHLNAEINVVSLIDVMLLLLVIFMLTAPMMQGGVDVDLPEGDARPTETKSGYTVSVDAQGNVYWNETKMTIAAFRGAVSTLIAGKQSEGIDLRADKGATWEVIAPVIAAMNAAGVTKVGVVLIPDENRRK